MIAQDLTLHAKWLRRALWYTDATFHLEAAATYDGYLIDPGSGESVVGTVSVKVGRPGTKDGMCKVNATVLMAGEKKQSFKGKTYDGTFEGVSKDGRTLSLRLGTDSLTGSFGRCAIDGSRNVFMSKDADSKLRSAQALRACQGSFVAAWLTDSGAFQGWNGLSFVVGSKGKVKVSGALVDGTKVSAKSQLLVGERECALAVSWAKKGAPPVACLVWFCEDGAVECANLPGGGHARIANAREGAYLKAGSAFSVDADGLSEVIPGLLADLLPEGLGIRMKGVQFDVDKAGRVSAKGGVLDLSKAGANPSGLKVRYRMKDGTYSGSFNAYTLVGGRLKKVKVQVAGVVLGGRGYGSASVKKAGARPATIAPAEQGR